MNGTEQNNRHQAAQQQVLRQMPDAAADTLTDEELAAFEAELLQFRLHPVPPRTEQRMQRALLPPAPARDYRRYLAAAAVVALLAVCGVGLEQEPSTPLPFYAPLFACVSGLFLLTSPGMRFPATRRHG